MATPPTLDPVELKITRMAVAQGWEILCAADTRLWMAAAAPLDPECHGGTPRPSMKRLPAAVMERLLERGAVECVSNEANASALAGARYRLTPAALTALHLASSALQPVLDSSRFTVIGAGLGRDVDDGTAWGIVSLVTPGTALNMAAKLARLARSRTREGKLARMPTIEMAARMVPMASFQAMRMRRVTSSVWTGQANDFFSGTDAGHDLRVRHAAGACGEPIRVLAERPSTRGSWTEIGQWRERHLVDTLLSSETGKHPDVGPLLLEGYMDELFC